ncbi:MAG: pyridoxal 5'-phosphate synthase glutaminase subunit PdxT [Nocardioidaceae bacterium]
MSEPTIGVLALQGDVREHLRMLAAAGATGVSVRRPSELAAVDGMIVPGGESTTMHKLAVVFEMFEPLRERIASGMPTFGTCAGMIMLADRIEGGMAGQETFGGIDMTVRRNAFGRQVDSFEADVAFGSPPETLHAVFIRAPWVEKVGNRTEVLATVRGGVGDGRIVAVRQGHLVATSFHPEISGDDRIHRYFVDMVR